MVLEVLSITLYSIVFYRYYSKRRLTKSMDMRDKARSDLYLAQLRSQSAPNTPGFGPKSPAFSQYALSPRFPPSAYTSLNDISEAPSFTPNAPVVEPASAFAENSSPTSPSKPFSLQAPPKKAPSATPKMPAGAFTAKPQEPMPSSSANMHAPMAPGEQQYAAVPIPGAYADAAIKSPGYR